MRRLGALQERDAAPSRDLWLEPHAKAIQKDADRIGKAESAYDVMYAAHSILGTLEGVVEQVRGGEDVMKHLEQARRIIASKYLRARPVR